MYTSSINSTRKFRPRNHFDSIKLMMCEKSILLLYWYLKLFHSWCSLCIPGKQWEKYKPYQQSDAVVRSFTTIGIIIVVQHETRTMTLLRKYYLILKTSSTLLSQHQQMCSSVVFSSLWGKLLSCLWLFDYVTYVGSEMKTAQKVSRGQRNMLVHWTAVTYGLLNNHDQ